MDGMAVPVERTSCFVLLFVIGGYSLSLLYQFIKQLVGKAGLDKVMNR